MSGIHGALSVEQLGLNVWEREGRDTWAGVVSQMPTSGPFLCTAWVDSWLAVYGQLLAPVQLRVLDPKRASIGTCLLTSRVRRKAVLPHVRMHLNTDGEDGLESVIVEHNSMLAVAGAENVVTEAIAQHVCSMRADEFRVAGAGATDVDRLTHAFDGWTADIEWHDAPFVDLAKLRETGRLHLDVLSRNTREQLRRSLALYSRCGPLHVQEASTSVEAEDMFNELVQLHEARWSAAGHTGAFASPRRRAFHDTFIRRALPLGNAQLLRVSAGDTTIGVLYNLVANGRVNFYQSGLSVEQDGHLKPGMVAHHLAIQHCLERGLDEYDFLSSPPGAGRYKQSLSSDSRRLAQLNLTRPGWRSRYFDRMRSIRRSASSLVTRFSPAHASTAESRIFKPS